MHPESRLRRAWVARIGGIHPLPFATASHSTTPGNGGVQAAACAVSAVARRRLRWDTLQVVLALLLLATLSIPGSLYPRYSAIFVVTDYMRSVALLLMIAASVRGARDLRRLAWLQIVGVTFFCAISLARGQVDADGRLVVLTYYNSNDLALLIVSTLPLTLYLWRRPAGLVSRAVLKDTPFFLV